jgi:hypothetical protein
MLPPCAPCSSYRAIIRTTSRAWLLSVIPTNRRRSFGCGGEFPLLLGAIAQFERARIVERTKAGRHARRAEQGVTQRCAAGIRR